jgi:hypothetical protein
MPELSNYEEADYFAHFPSQVSQAMVDYATEVAFKWSRYIFTRREGKKQYGYCTHCGKEFRTDGLIHNEKAICPECKSTCCVKASGKGRKSMIDEVYFVYYEKSAVNPQAIVARGIYAIRDYRFDYHNVETQFTTITMYVFEPGSARMMKRYAYFSYQYGLCTVGNWEKCKSVSSMFNRDYIAHIKVFSSQESIKEAVKDTPFSWSGWELYHDEDMVKFFSLYAKYPCVEYLIKLGLKNFVEAKICGFNTYSAINWRATSLLKVLKLSKADFKEIRAFQKDINPLFLRLFQISRKDGSNLTFGEISEMKNLYFEDLQKALKHTTLRQIRNYINRQHASQHSAAKEEIKNMCCSARIPITHSKPDILRTWNDYIADCQTLEMNLDDERILYPKNLFDAHQKTTKRVKSQGNKPMDKKIKARLSSLAHYCFEYNGLMIRPAESTNELITEGKALTICVGNYANGYMTKYSKGQTNILLIRKISEPNKPYYTMELRKDAIIQVHGERHCAPDKAVAEFIKAFTDHKLNRAKAKAKIPA